jgi:cell division septum initiation protein DivIVA
VIIKNVLKGDNFKAYTSHLSPTDQNVAKTLLQNQYDQLRQRILRYLDNAYGIDSTEKNALGTLLEEAEHFQSLMPGFEPRPPAAANLNDALLHLLSQALEFQYPGHPQFDENIKLSGAVLKKVFGEIEKACNAPDGRVLVEKSLRKDVRLVANPLKIGSMEETHFILSHSWKDHFLKMQADTNEALTVGLLRQWIDQPKPMGLPKVLENLIIMTFAAQTNRVFFDGDTSIEPNIEDLRKHYELREMDLPSAEDWEKAIERAGYILGITQSELLNASNVAKFSDNVRAELSNYQEASTHLQTTLDKLWTTRKDLDKSAKRVSTAAAAKSFITDILQTDGTKLIEGLANWESKTTPAPTDAAMGTSIKKAPDVNKAISEAQWSIIEKAENLKGNQKEKAEQLTKDLKDALEEDEYVIALAPKIKSIQGQALQLIEAAIEESQTPHHGQGKPGTTVKKTGGTGPITKDDQYVTIKEQEEKDLSPAEFQNVFNEILDLMNQENARIELSWRIYKKSTDKSDK